MVDIVVRDATPDDIDVVAERMRAADLAEVHALGHTPHEALVLGLTTSTYAKTAAVDGEPAIIFGVRPVSVLTGLGCPWLLGTDDVTRIKRPFIKQCRHYVDEMSKVYPRLVNVVDVRNTVSIRWLQWLGFEMGDPVPLGINGELFHPFGRNLSHV